MEPVMDPDTVVNGRLSESDCTRFPIDLSKYQEVELDPWARSILTEQQRDILRSNIALCRDAVVFFTALGGVSGYGGHTGGAFDMIPEVCILDAFFRARPDKFVPTFFDEAGHRVAVQYLFAVLRGHIPAERLLHYRVGHSALPGHPELGLTRGVQFSSGRLGHLWGHVNGIARAEPGRVVCCFSSDGSQMEGNTAEAARMAVAQNLNVKLFVDDNDTTIAGHPSSYLKGFNVGRTLRGHGLSSEDVEGEDLDLVYKAMCKAVSEEGPFAVILKRSMCPGIQGLEGSTDGHDAMPLLHAVQYLESRGHAAAADMLTKVCKTCDPHQRFWGSGQFGAPRQVFGETVVRVLGRMDADERRSTVLVVDSDLEGSCGLKKVRENFPEVYIKGGIMERGNFSACAGFGFARHRQAVFGTFAAFQEMILSEVTMARLNHCNVLCHFSHSGVDDMSDNTCHFGLNNFFADNGLQSEICPDTNLFFPADIHQTSKLVEAIFWKEGLRFVYTTRSKVPEILCEHGQPFYGEGYAIKLGTDDIIIGGDTCDGYIVSYGDGLYRSFDAVQRLRHLGINIGLVNKWHVNAVDDRVMSIIGRSRFVLVVESQNIRTGLGLRLGTELLERNLTPRFGRCGTHRDGCCGTWEHAYHQGYDTASITEKVIEIGKFDPELAGKVKMQINTPLYESHKQRAVARPLSSHCGTLVRPDC
ncbi:Tktl2 [Symbiodinium sp. CCMP2592]|nr:Tktl2 [Symbiodinium sp. CCMP2592]